MPTAYVTGADRGLGLALVKALLADGFRVYAGSYLPDWPELSQLAGDHPQQLTVLSLDVTDEASVQAAAGVIEANGGSLDLLINNAGIHPKQMPTILEPLDFDEFLRLYNVNALGSLRVTHSVIRLLLAGTMKKLVNISSEAGSISGNHRNGNFGYTMSKAALNMQSAILKKHLKEYGVKVLNIHPGYVRSYMLGTFNEEATVEACDSAAGILRLIAAEYDPDDPYYLDYQGKSLGW